MFRDMSAHRSPHKPQVDVEAGAAAESKPLLDDAPSAKAPVPTYFGLPAVLFSGICYCIARCGKGQSAPTCTCSVETIMPCNPHRPCPAQRLHGAAQQARPGIVRLQRAVSTAVLSVRVGGCAC